MIVAKIVLIETPVAALKVARNVVRENPVVALTVARAAVREKPVVARIESRNTIKGPFFLTSWISSASESFDALTLWIIRKVVQRSKFPERACFCC